MQKRTIISLHSKNIFIALILSLSLAACTGDACPSDKKTYLKNFNALMSETSSMRAQLDDPVWEEYDEKFRIMVEECYETHEDELTGREKRRFWAKAMGYYKNRYGKAALDQWIWGKKAEE